MIFFLQLPKQEQVSSKVDLMDVDVGAGLELHHRLLPDCCEHQSLPWQWDRTISTRVFLLTFDNKKEKGTFKYRNSKQPLPKLVTIELNGDVGCGV